MAQKGTALAGLLQMSVSADFERRIAQAIANGRHKRGEYLTEVEAAERARQVVDALPSLFTDQEVML